MHVHVPIMDVSQEPEADTAPARSLSTLLFETDLGSLTEPRSLGWIDWTGLADQQTPGILGLHPQGWDFRHMPTCLASCGDPNTELDAFKQALSQLSHLPIPSICSLQTCLLSSFS